jgi:calcium-dependent protein kinase
MRRLHHKNVLDLVGHYENRIHMHLVLELCSGGEVFDLLQHGMSELDCAHVMHQTLLAVQHCHENNVIHRDLKPQNLLLKAPVKDIDQAEVKVVDFGASKIYDSSGRSGGLREVMGTISYMAPEVILARTRGYNSQCDLWSLGVILYQMVSGEKPFSNQLDIQNGKWSFREEEWTRVSQDCKNMVRRMLEVDPFKRINATEALAHQWIAKFTNAKCLSVKHERTFSSTPRRRGVRRGSETGTASPRAKRKHNIHGPRARAAMKTFVTHSKVTRELSYSVANAFKEHGPAVATSLQEQFRAIDQNNDGTITLDELSQYVKCYGGLEKDVAEITHIFDLDGDFKIDYHEFMRVGTSQGNASAPENGSQEKELRAVVAVPPTDSELIGEIKSFMTAYYKAERQHTLGRLRGKLVTEAKRVHAAASQSTSRSVRFALQDIQRLGLF